MKKIFLVALMWATHFLAGAQSKVGDLSDNLSDPARYPLIPYPTSLTPASGTFVVNGQTALSVPRDAFSSEQLYLREMLRRYLGGNVLKSGPKTAGNTIVLAQDNSIPEEGYRLSVTSKQVILTAASPAGMFYAIQTLRQLLPAEVENGHGQFLRVPAAQIADLPAFEWRGLMLDVSRHFFSTAYLKKYIDMMALYKLNRLHLHLTDDQGWRIEIKKYPLLTSAGAWRTFNDQDSSCMGLAEETGNPDFKIDPAYIRTVNGQTQYGGFYTQEEMREVIQYAGSRHVEIIPEIDMPGHMMAAIRQYPQLTCDGKKGDDAQQGFSIPICPFKDSTLEFAEDVFTEITDLFPYRYVHIGGDEVEKNDWNRSPLVQQFMQRQHLSNMDEVQSYFNDYMQSFFHGRGKTLLGWDEIVDGGIDSSAAVMFWRPWATLSPLKATANGNKVIMSPDGPLYFDAFPDRNSLSSVYHYNPLDTMYGMNARQQKNIIGVQGNLWTERVPSGERADYMVMPRLSALAELGWTHKDLYTSYLLRLEDQYDRLDRLQINYRLADLPEVADHRVFTDTSSFMTRSGSPRLRVRYTLDGSLPVRTSPVLSHPVRISRTLTMKMAAFTAAGRRGDIQSVFFTQQPNAVSVPPPSSLQQGLRCEKYRGHFARAADIRGTIDTAMVLPAAAIPPTIPSSAFGLRFSGYIEVPATAIYSFFLTSNDGSVLKIAGRPVVDNDGYHGDQEKSGQVALQKGLHAFSLDFMDGGGGYALDLRYSIGNGKPQPIPVSWYRHQ